MVSFVILDNIDRVYDDRGHGLFLGYCQLFHNYNFFTYNLACCFRSIASSFYKNLTEINMVFYQ